MHEIKQFEFKKDKFGEIKAYRFGRNWPTIYILEGGKEAYIGETTSAYKRAKQHYENQERAKLSQMYLIADEEYNKSATLDIESLLIKYIAGDGKYLLQNSNHGLQESNYFDREKYQAKFEIVWKNLRDIGIAKNALEDIQNSDLFKYSPYKSLTEDQYQVVDSILESIKNGVRVPNLVSGEPGTGKTIVATYIAKALAHKKWATGFKVGLVIPMVSLRDTLKKVFRSIKGLSPNMVLGPNEVVGRQFDVLIVDEAHRLTRRKNLTNFVPFDNANKAFGLSREAGTQLDWIIRSSKHQILFYDAMQSVKPADIRVGDIARYGFTKYELKSQMRVLGGQDYVEYVARVLNCEQVERKVFEGYEVKLVEDATVLVNIIKQKDNEVGLSRLVSGYAWEWKTSKHPELEFDFELDGNKLKWNSVNKNWVNSPNAVNEVGCIHTIQGYDLNYAGVIIGPEISYDSDRNKIVVDRKKYYDRNGWRGVEDPKELETYIKNIYKTLLTRGIRGTYIYVVDRALRSYLGKFFPNLTG